jgi:predicted protein tyrosine phosphatase
MHPLLAVALVYTLVQYWVHRRAREIIPSAEDETPLPGSLIMHWLYLGNQNDAMDIMALKHAGITHILNMTDHDHGRPARLYDAYGLDIHYMGIPAEDSPTYNIKRHFNTTNAFIESARQSHGKILVHCQAGISRSATVVAAYLCAHEHMTADNAIAFLRQQRRIVHPNPGFMRQLHQYCATLPPMKRALRT